MINPALVRRRRRFAGDPYAVLGFRPDLVFDFDGERYRTSGSTTTFSSAITHSASSRATMVDSDGLLKWRPHNLVTYSNAFSNAVWGKEGTPTIAQDETGPDGTANTAWTITDNDAVNREGLYRIGAGRPAINADSAQYDFCLFVKKTTGAVSFPGMQLFLSGGTTQNGGVMINTNTGTLTDRAVFSPANKSITEVGDFWLVCITMVNNGTNTGLQPEFYPAITASDTGTWDNTLTGSAVIYGDCVYRSDLGGMVDNPDQSAGFETYVPTTSAARYLPRRGHHVYNGTSWVNEGLLHERAARVNLITYSEDFTQWTNEKTTDLAAQATGPDGTLSMALLKEDSTVGRHIIYVTLNGSLDVARTFSVYVKKPFSNGRRYVALSVPNTGDTLAYSAIFDLDNGTVSATKANGTATVSANIEDVGNGIYRCVLSGNSNSATTANYFPMIGLSDRADFTGTLISNNLPLYTGDNTSGVYIWGAQLEAASTASSYIPTSGSTATRDAGTLTVPAANLPWPTPRVIGPELFSDFPSEGEWVDNGDGSWTVTNATTNTDLRADGLTTLGKHYEYSFDITTTAPLIVYLSSTVPVFYSSGSYTFNSVATSSFFLFRATPGTTATVSNISVREIDPLSVSIQMDGLETFADEGSATQETLFDWRVDSNNRITLALDTDSTKVGTLTLTMVNGSGTDETISTTAELTPGVNDPFNVAIVCTSNEIGIALDGTAETRVSHSIGLPDLSGADATLGGNGTRRLVRAWNQDITDAGIEAASVTAPLLFGLPTISGNTNQGATLTATSAPLVIGTPTPTTTWQWNRSGTPIAGATSSTYTLVEADVGSTITVTQTETNSGGSATATSAATDVIVAVPAGAIAQRDGDYILDRAANYIEVRA